MTLAEALMANPDDFFPGEILMARRVLAEAEKSPLMVVAWKEASHGEGKTKVCKLEEVSARSKRVLVRYRPQGKDIHPKAITSYASSLLNIRALTDEEIKNMFHQEVNTTWADEVLDS